jgi:hypothetical protein
MLDTMEKALYSETPEDEPGDESRFFNFPPIHREHKDLSGLLSLVAR